MNETKQKQLFAAARAVAPVEPPSNFASSVMSEISRDRQQVASGSLSDQLAALFPRLATAALVVTAVAALFGFSFGEDFATQLAQVSDQWWLSVAWL